MMPRITKKCKANAEAYAIPMFTKYSECFSDGMIDFFMYILYTLKNKKALTLQNNVLKCIQIKQSS